MTRSNRVKVYIVYYIHTDIPDFSEILSTYTTKDKAVRGLIEFANYRQDNDGNLTQYFMPTDDYESYNELYNIVDHELELTDVDIYRISEMYVL